MVSVVIIATVIMAMLQLFSNNTRFFLHLDGKSSLVTNATLLIGAKDYGFEDKKVTLYDLVDGFDVDNEVRRSLKSYVIELEYQEVTRLDGDDMSDNAEALVETGEEVKDSSSGSTSLEIGKTVLKTKDQRSSFLRIKLQ